jgi:hypothetical protein
MTLTAPEWLTRHGGALQLASDGRTLFVLFANEAQYSLTPVPVGGQFGCAIRQTINGQRLASNSRAPTAEAALQAGLEDLRQALGW